METKLKIINRHRSGDAIGTINRDMHLSRNTVRSVLRKKGPHSTSYVRTKWQYPALGNYLEILMQYLRDDKDKKRKRTARQLFKELELQGYKGSYSALGRYVSKWKKRTTSISPSACVPLSFDKGEAYQFDWSTEHIIIAGEAIQVKVAHFVLCYSGKKFIYIYPNETQEMLFDAHIRAFEYFGGTPLRGIYDNMKTAVTKVLQGIDREWNKSFMRLCAHYKIEPVACTPAKGNEKGKVERQVQTARTQFFTPMPEGTSISELNDRLMSQLNTYNASCRHPKYKDKTLDEVFMQEAHCLINAPLPFDGCKETDIKVSTTCLARLHRNNYSVHCICASNIVQCKAYADKLVFIYDGQEVACHKRKFTVGETYYNWQHYLPILSRKPRALRNGAPFKDMILPEALNNVRMHLEQRAGGQRDFAHILSYIPIKSMESVVEACQMAIQDNTISKDVIINLVLRNNKEPPCDEMAISNIPLHHIPIADCNIYNSLLSEVSA